ncbi:hypothetical protein [uncultured Albimonas sp.]|uniref:hypothetical protein n=1 Tax=uncultured Albimonas sp. TaxID=1331701 RepID=UPI0030EC46D0
MDLNGGETLERPEGDAATARVGRLAAAEAWPAGGAGLFREPQPGLRALADLGGAIRAPLRVGPGGLEIAATSTIAEMKAPGDGRVSVLAGARG